MYFPLCVFMLFHMRKMCTVGSTMRAHKTGSSTLPVNETQKFQLFLPFGAGMGMGVDRLQTG